MLEKIKELTINIKDELSKVKTKSDLELFRSKFLVKKGVIQKLFEQLRTVSPENKPIIGKELNILSKFAEQQYMKLKEILDAETNLKVQEIDITLPGRRQYHGTYHPVRQIIDEIVTIFKSIGFDVAEGPQIEDSFYNFDALNFQSDHPARDMQDTFFIKHNTSTNGNDILLRTHTSPVQIRVMQAQKPPIRCIMPGRVYRNEAINSRSLAEFHQVEGLYINKNVTFAELKATMIVFAKKMYGEDSKFRFRPSYFPFTEPSAEFDISCYLCKGQGCKICKGTGWLEIAGCGMVHPNVLKSGGIDTEKYMGYAFGFGIERIVLLKTGIDDIRYLYENDIRLLQQF